MGKGDFSNDYLTGLKNKIKLNCPLINIFRWKRRRWCGSDSSGRSWPESPLLFTRGWNVSRHFCVKPQRPTWGLRHRGWRLPSTAPIAWTTKHSLEKDVQGEATSGVLESLQQDSAGVIRRIYASDGRQGGEWQNRSDDSGSQRIALRYHDHIWALCRVSPGSVTAFDLSA